MNKHLKNILFVILLLSVFNTAFAVLKINDSLVEKLVAEGTAKFKKLQQENDEHIKNKEYDKLNFIINVGSNNNLINHEILTTEKFIDNLTKEQALNSRLQQLFINSNNSKQCYLLLISYFDVEVKATPPDGLTVEDVFNTGKFYNENSTIKDCKDLHNIVTADIENSLSVDKSNFYYLISLGRYRMVFHESEKPKSAYTWFSHSNTPVNQTPPSYFNETYDYLRQYLISSKDKRYNSRETIVEDYVTAFEQAYKNAPLKAQILSTYTPEGLITIFQQFHPTDYHTLSVQERLHCLSVFAGYSMSGNITVFNNNEEGYALKLIHNINKNDLVQFFQGLSEQSILKNNSNYDGEKDDKVLIVKLINKIDDGILGGENYGKLISIILNHFNGSETLLENYLSNQDYDTKEIKYYSTDVIPTTSEAGTINYDVTLNDNGKLDIAREIAYRDVNLAGDCIDFGDGCYTTHWETLDPVNGINPFSIILFTNYSKLSMVEELQTSNEFPLIAPAVVLKYCDDKDFNNVTVKRLTLALDAVTVVTGLGAIKQALNTHRYARALYEAAQILSAGGNFVVNATNDPEIDALKQEYDNIMLVWDMANIVNGSGKLITKAYNSVKNGTGKRISKNVAQNFMSHYEQLKASGKQLPANFKKLYVYLKAKVGGVTSNALGLSVYAGKITKGVNNLLTLESPTGLFRQLKGINGQTYRAATFWSDQGPHIVHYVSQDAKYYIKHDPTNGRVLFIDVDNNKFMGFMLDQDNIIGTNYNSLVENFKTIHGLPNSVRNVNINGTIINFADDKANLVLGKYNPNQNGVVGEIGTDDVISQMTILKNYSFADNSFELRNGSVHVLNIPDGNVSQWSTFFEDFNKQFLDLATQNSSIFKTILVSDPRKAQLLRGTTVIDGKFIPSGFAKEIKYIRDRGIKNVSLKDGTILNLDDIDLTNLNWSGWIY